jgi:hypothetical protein
MRRMGPEPFLLFFRLIGGFRRLEKFFVGSGWRITLILGKKILKRGRWSLLIG